MFSPLEEVITPRDLFDRVGRQSIGCAPTDVERENPDRALERLGGGGEFAFPEPSRADVRPRLAWDVAAGLNGVFPLLELAKSRLGRGLGASTELQAALDRLAGARTDAHLELPVDSKNLAALYAEGGLHTRPSSGRRPESENQVC